MAKARHRLFLYVAGKTTLWDSPCVCDAGGASGRLVRVHGPSCTSPLKVLRSLLFFFFCRGCVSCNPPVADQRGRCGCVSELASMVMLPKARQ